MFVFFSKKLFTSKEFPKQFVILFDYRRKKKLKFSSFTLNSISKNRKNFEHYVKLDSFDFLEFNEKLIIN